MNQTQINLNIINSIIIVTKALTNINLRQVILFQRQQDHKFVDLCELDNKLIAELLENLSRLKGRL